MYKLIIVDDEEEVRQGITNKIDWGKYNFEVMGSVSNGIEALELMEEGLPEVILTDISMPLMDGLELVKNVNTCYPTVKCIILTGYDDFKYAQQAIKYEVLDYILKPILPNDMEELLLKLSTQLDGEMTRKEDLIMLRKHYQESLPVLKDKFLTSLILGKTNPGEFEKKCKHFNLNLKGNIFSVSAISIDSSTAFSGNMDEDYYDLMTFAVSNISSEIVSKNPNGEVFTHEDMLVVILAFENCSRINVINRSFSILEEIRQNVEKYLKLTITIGLGSIADSADGLRESYRDALSAMEYRQVMGSNKVIYIEDLEPQPKDNIVFDEDKERILVTAIKFGNKKEIGEAVSLLFNGITGDNISLMEYQLYLMEILASISKLCRQFQVDMYGILGINTNLYQEIFRFNSMKKIRDWFEEISYKLMNYMADLRHNTTKMLLEMAKDYILKNYSDNELSIQKLASHLHISSCYLSMIFKKETGETFLKYLVNIRLNKAKELLGSTDLKTSEIAEKIGYPDLNYFSFFFKKNYGISPREYRSSLSGSKT